MAAIDISNFFFFGTEFEPFDSRLKDRLEALTAQKNSLVEKVADLRRTAPALAAQAYQAAFLQESEQWEQEYRTREAKALQAPESVLDLGELRRWDEVQRTWERGAEGLGALKGGLPETRARLERAGEVVGYLEGK
jgi:kinetochor protein Mis14/NSL1